MGSPAATRWQPNERLLAQRLRRAWSLEDVVRELCDLADRLGERPLGVNATMVYNWEKGRHRPRPPYPRLLCLLYECSAEELGLWEPAGFSELRRAGGLIVPPPGFAGRWPERPLRVTEATIHNLESVSAAYRRMYHTVAAHDLIDDVAQHAQTTTGFWRRTADPELRRTLAAAASEITMLAGRMSFFDLGRPSQAEPYYQDALEAAQEAQDRALQAVVLGNKSFLPRSRGDFAAAMQLLDQAKRLVPDDPVVRSWAMALEAMTKAWAHEPAESLAALEAAEGVLDDAVPGTAPAWFDYYDRPRLASRARSTSAWPSPKLPTPCLRRPSVPLIRTRPSSAPAISRIRPRSVSTRVRSTRPASLASRRSSSWERSSTRRESSESATFAPSCGLGGIIRPSPP
jgi:hypothetical protein